MYSPVAARGVSPRPVWMSHLRRLVAATSLSILAACGGSSGPVIVGAGQGDTPDPDAQASLSAVTVVPSTFGSPLDVVPETTSTADAPANLADGSVASAPGNDSADVESSTDVPDSSVDGVAAPANDVPESSETTEQLPDPSPVASPSVETAADESIDLGTPSVERQPAEERPVGIDVSNPSADPPPSPEPARRRPGLDERPSLATFDIPLDDVADGGYRLVEVYPDLPIFLEMVGAVPFPGEDRVLAVEQAGRLKVFDDDPGVTQTTTVLDMTARVAFSSEQGLLGFTFDPDFADNDYVYLYYTRPDPLRSVITRMVWDRANDRPDTGSERVLLQVDQPYKGHNGGALEFGPDGYLYLSLGDGGDGGDPRNSAQDLSRLLGKIIRIDVHPDDPNRPYAIPEDNPFVDVAGARPEIWALGFRNPYRFTFDSQTGELWFGDVGQSTLEEVGVAKRGENHGWRVFEGTSRYNDQLNTLPDSAFTPPVHTYGHDEGIAVIGGYVYRGERVASLFGRYLFADFGSGSIWSLGRDGSTVDVDRIGRVDAPTGFARSRSGDVMVISRYEGLFRFEPVSREATVPIKLSRTGLFDDVASLDPIDGLIEYRPAHPFWSDGVGKRRWLGVPDDRKIGFSDDDWTFPVGSVSVKHFYLDTVEGDARSRRRLETRVLVHTRAGWRGYSYHWDDDQRDATLANERREETLRVRLRSGETRSQRYVYPSRGDCAACHTPAAAYLLGPKTAQLNVDFDYPDGPANQVETFEHIGLFDRDTGGIRGLDAYAPVEDVGTDVAARARAYLDVNCSSCHQPGGPAPTDIDLRSTVSVPAMKVSGVAPSKGDLGITDARIVAPGNRAASVLWERLRRLDDSRMPPLSTHVVDAAAVQLIGEWIDGGL